MDFLIDDLIDKKEAERYIDIIQQDKTLWISGKKTAGSHAAAVKNNLQLERKSDPAIQVSDLITKAIRSNQLIKSFTIPRRIHGLLFSETSSGQGYGVHLDNPFMSTGRSDLSFTLFLNSPDEYKGGELSIQTMQENKKIKLSQGEIVIYPCSYLHSVETVTSGKRIVCVGWIQSYVKNNEDRNSLFSLDAGAKKLLADYGRSPELDLIFQSYSNLLRTLGD